MIYKKSDKKRNEYFKVFSIITRKKKNNNGQLILCHSYFNFVKKLILQSKNLDKNSYSTIFLEKIPLF